tara:strand:- start:106 stop:408 length:303 start_codon:yes stop_codon:yes gene_type:complete
MNDSQLYEKSQRSNFKIVIFEITDLEIYVGPHPLYMKKVSTAAGTILSHALNFVYIIGVMCVTGNALRGKKNLHCKDPTGDRKYPEERLKFWRHAHGPYD